MLGLALLGCAHAIFVFVGDILVLYAVLGALLWPLRHASVRTLTRWAWAMLPVATVALVALIVALGVLLGDAAGGQIQILESGALGGTFAEATQSRLESWPGFFAVLLLFQGPMAFGAFTAGLAAGKAGFFEAGCAGRAWLQRVAPWCAALGLAANVFVAWAMNTESLAALIAMLLMPTAAAALSLAWLRLIIWIDEALTVPRLFVLAGRNSLTTYVLQGVLAGAAFGGYGLGLFGTLGHAALLVASVGLAVAAMAATALAAHLSARGPLEHLLRWFTRLRG